LYTIQERKNTGMQTQPVLLTSCLLEVMSTRPNESPTIWRPLTLPSERSDIRLNLDSVAISIAKLRKLIKRVSVEHAVGSQFSRGRDPAPIEFKEEESTMKNSVVRTVIVLAAVSMAASGVMGADRTVVVEHFTATW
jgi:hypothetical protein